MRPRRPADSPFDRLWQDVVALFPMDGARLLHDPVSVWTANSFRQFAGHIALVSDGTVIEAVLLHHSLPTEMSRAGAADIGNVVRRLVHERMSIFPEEMERDALWTACLAGKGFRTRESMSLVDIRQVRSADAMAARLDELPIEQAWDAAEGQLSDGARQVFQAVRRSWRRGFPCRDAVLHVLERPAAYAADVLFHHLSASAMDGTNPLRGWIDLLSSRMQNQNAAALATALKHSPQLSPFAADVIQALLPACRAPEMSRPGAEPAFTSRPLTQQEFRVVEQWVWTNYQRPRQVQRGNVLRTDFMRKLEAFLGRELSREDKARVYTQIIGIKRRETHRLPLEPL